MFWGYMLPVRRHDVSRGCSRMYFKGAEMNGNVVVSGSAICVLVLRKMLRSMQLENSGYAQLFALLSHRLDSPTTSPEAC